MNTNIHSISATKRTVLGRNVKNLRREGMIPANIYGKGIASMAVSFPEKELVTTFSEAGQSSLVQVTVDSESFPVLFKNPVFDPMSDSLSHIDLYKVNLKEKITTEVPLELAGESPAVKLGLEMIEITSRIEVECLPTDLPEKIVVDISKLEKVDDMITVADLTLPKGVEVKTEAETVIVKVEEHKEEVIETVAPEVAPGEVPATEQKAPGEGEEAPAKKEE